MRSKLILASVLFLACGKESVPQKPPPTLSTRAGYEAIANDLRNCGSESRIVLNAEGGDSPKGPVLIFRLVNISQETLVTYPERLPWGNPNSIEVAASTLSGETAATVWPIVDSPPASRIAIAPGESLMGQAQLTYRLEHLGDLQKHGEVLVSWTYRSPFVEPPACRCVSGIALLPQRK